MEINRRDLLVAPAAAMAGSLFAAADVPWQRKIRRLGQLNMTEHDPVVLNVEEWADYWASSPFFRNQKGFVGNKCYIIRHVSCCDRAEAICRSGKAGLWRPL